MSNKNQHVVPHQDGWAIKGAGNEKATKVVSTQEKAIDIAREIAKNQQTEMFIHGKNDRSANVTVTDMTLILPKTNQDEFNII